MPGLIGREAEAESVAEMVARWNRDDHRDHAEIAKSEAAVRADFELAGLITRSARERPRRGSA